MESHRVRLTASTITRDMAATPVLHHAFMPLNSDRHSARAQQSAVSPIQPGNQVSQHECVVSDVVDLLLPMSILASLCRTGVKISAVRTSLECFSISHWSRNACRVINAVGYPPSNSWSHHPASFHVQGLIECEHLMNRGGVIASSPLSSNLTRASPMAGAG